LRFLLTRLAGLTCVGLLTGAVFAVSASAASAAVTLQGAGSTLVAPVEAEWAAAWDSATGNTVDYAAVGSGTGYKDVANGLVDFGASDAPLSVYSTPPCNCVQIPWALTATGVSFHVNGLRRLHLTGAVLAKIYLGQITNWDNSQIKKLNRGVRLPNLPITVFWRSDSSGDTYAFTRFLSDVNGSFASRVGSSTTVSFPVGTGAKGNTGMASAVQGTHGSIAYIAVSYIINDSLPAASVENSAGRFEVPNLGAIEAAARAYGGVPSNNQLTIVDPPRYAKSAYPISTYTYAIVPRNAPQGGLIRSFIEYALGQGQAFGPRLDFAALPHQVTAAGDRTLGQIQ
jgi:phosphate transport system substrate-binding protein